MSQSPRSKWTTPGVVPLGRDRPGEAPSVIDLADKDRVIDLADDKLRQPRKTDLR